MQHKYVGDIGDYIKLALLRQLEPNHRIGVVWWLFPDEADKGDGRHIPYLGDPRWRRYDPDLFDALKGLIDSKQRNIHALQASGVLNQAIFIDEPVPVGLGDRATWVDQSVRAVADCDIVFLDPDNGLEPRSFIAGRKASGKSVAYKELEAFRRQGRTVIVYHHQTRAPGGHKKEIGDLEEKLRQSFDRIEAIRASPFSPRVFFLLDPSTEVVERAKELCDWWSGNLEMNPHRGA